MLNQKQLSIASISSYTAISDTVNLTTALNQGLDDGLTINEVKEIFVQLCMYCGFPRGIRGTDIFIDVLSARKAKGIDDKYGRDASIIKDNLTKFERGLAVHTTVTGLTEEQLHFGAMSFIPKIDIQLKEYVFADVYESNVLTYAEREIITVSALMAMNDIEPQIRFHINTAFQVGLSEEDIRSIIAVMEKQFGPEKGEMGRRLIAKVISSRDI